MKTLIILLSIIAAASLQANALSIASDYLANDTLELIEGASKIYGIRLQNPSDYEIGIKLVYDPTFMKAIDFKEVYYVPAKTTGYSISFNITAPKKPGLYQVSYTVGEVEPSASGGLPIRLKINKGFKLKVIKTPDSLKPIQSPSSLRAINSPRAIQIKFGYLVYAAVALVLLIYMRYYGKIKKRKFK
ncbi:MAG: hypothetical protein AABX33_06300 [Nanoarchaeota archaeon]